jgi:DNA adenine methylase
MEKNKNVKPFLKWVGGKNQLIKLINEHYPEGIFSGDINKYVEPFVGGGAVLFNIFKESSISKFYICDINKELINTYKIIQCSVLDLVEVLALIQKKYYQFSEEQRKRYFYEIREEFNINLGSLEFCSDKSDRIMRAAHLIFLNRTCYNGLYRVNNYGSFNVPYGRYKNPRICDEENLLMVSKVLSKTEIIQGNFESFTNVIDEKTFVYFDPPYRPISNTSSFTSYSLQQFDEKQQRRLAKYFRQMNSVGAKIMLSNSDPDNIPEESRLYNFEYRNFYDNEFRNYGFNIYKVSAKRNINSKADLRGTITELLITNY